MVVYGTIGRNDGWAAAAEERTEEEAKKVVAKVLLPLENPLTAQLKVELPFVNTRRVEQRKAEKEKKKLRSSSIVVQMKELCRLWEPQFFSNITKPWESIDDLQGKKKKWIGSPKSYKPFKIRRKEEKAGRWL